MSSKFIKAAIVISGLSASIQGSAQQNFEGIEVNIRSAKQIVGNIDLTIDSPEQIAKKLKAIKILLERAEQQGLLREGPDTEDILE
jgi:hypothetical protein